MAKISLIIIDPNLHPNMILYKIFGDKGKHARSAVGVNELPVDAAVEIEMIVKLK